MQTAAKYRPPVETWQATMAYVLSRYGATDDQDLQDRGLDAANLLMKMVVGSTVYCTAEFSNALLPLQRAVRRDPWGVWVMKVLAKDTFQSSFCAEQLKALSEPLRLRIVDLLRDGEMAVSDLATALDVGVVTVSHHLQNLRHAQIVTTRRSGRFIYYSLRKNLLQCCGKSRQLLDLGCCKIEVPRPDSR